MIVYTGAGGRDRVTGKQTADQTFDYSPNAALIVSEQNGLPVRVIRGSRGDPAYSPKVGLRYDGLFRVESHWYGKDEDSGFTLCRSRLVKLSAFEANPYLPARNSTGATAVGSASTGGASGSPPDSASRDGKAPSPPAGTQNPGRGIGVTVRVVRDSAVPNWVKSLYNYACQICGTVLDLPVGHYAEGAHIRPLGTPHNGADTIHNVLCLCPLHHVLFDKAAVFIGDDWRVRDHHGADLGPLTPIPEHAIDVDHVQYHRATSGF